MSHSVIQPTVACCRCGIVLSTTLPRDVVISQGACDVRQRKLLHAIISAELDMEEVDESSSTYRALEEGVREMKENLGPGPGLCSSVTGTGSRCSRCGLYDCLPGVDHDRWCQRQREATLVVQRRAQAMLARAAASGYPAIEELHKIASLIDDD